MPCSNCEREIGAGLYTGPALIFDEIDFHEEHLNQPRGIWGIDTPNPGCILHSFQLDNIPDDCEIKSGKLIVEVSRQSIEADSDNDELWITHSGGQLAQSEWIWGNNGSEGDDPANGLLINRTIELDLNNDSLTSVSNGRLSFFIQNETQILCAELKLKISCSNAIAVLKPLNSSKTIEVNTEPWGIVTIPVYHEGDKVIAHTKGTFGETSYYVSLYELDPVPWQITTKVWYGWVCGHCKVPELIDIETYLPSQHRSNNGGYKSNTYYSFKLGVVEPWHEAYMAFMVE